MIDTKAFKSTMKTIYQALLKEKEFLEGKGVDIQGASESENINKLIQRTKGTSFKLLVMGEFSSGKSTFINVLLGEKLLPEGAVPKTALITEIYYGQEKRVIMYPKPGKWPGGNAPFDIEPKLSEIEKYSTIDNKGRYNKKEANRVDSCFEKMVVCWPLELLKDGVTIVDSPGLNDPFSNDYIVKNYVPKVDAILFCVNGTQAYSAEDKKTLQLLNSSGFKNPIIATTYFDVVTDGLEPKEIQEFVDINNMKYEQHTEKGFCHYVNSRLGMRAKKEGSQSALVDSGYYELEKFLAKYLTEEKGREKILAATSAIKAYNKGQKKTLNSVMANLDVPLGDFNQRIADTQKRLEQAKLQGSFLLREFAVEMNDAKDEVDKLIPKLYEGLYDNVDLDDFEPDISFDIWSPKESSKQIAEECNKELELRNKQYVGDWNNRVFVPKVTELLQKATSKMQRQFETFSQDIQDAKLVLEIGAADVDTDVHTETKVAMVAYALLTGNWMTALMGGIFGAGAFGRTVACQFAAGFIVGIIGLFTPIGLPMVALASIVGLIGGIGWNASVAAKTIKSKTAKELRKSLEDNKEELMAKATAECGKIFDNLQAQLAQAVKEDIASVEDTIRTIQEERGRNEAKARKRKDELAGVIGYLDGVDDSMDKIRKGLGTALR